WIGNLMLVVINLPLIGLWVKLLKVPYRLLFPAIVAFCCIGLFSISKDGAQVIMAGIMGLVGFALYKLQFEPAPLALCFVLGRLLVEELRQALIILDGGVGTFVRSRQSAVLLLLALGALAVAVLPGMRK